MANKCILCGEDLLENGQCPNAENHFKKMCLNCTFCVDGVCTNEENKNSVLESLKQSIKMPSTSYEIEDIKIKPIALKDPTKKCPKYCMNKELVQAAIIKYGEL